MLHKNYGINENGHLTLCGADTVMLAKKYGTPLYLMDETLVRERMRMYRKATEKYFGNGSGIHYASTELLRMSM